MVQERLLVRTKSRLECLPVEIIEHIFLYSLEINLPRVSVHIARALSNPTIYKWLIQLLFSCTDKDREVPLSTLKLLPPQVDIQKLDGETRKNLRTLILRCQWCTLPLIRECQRDLIENVIRTRCQGLESLEEESDALSNIRSYFEKLEGYDKAPKGCRGKGDLTLRLRAKIPESEASEPSVDYHLAVWFNLGAIRLCEPGMAEPYRGVFELPICEGSQLPDKLLCPPWTDSKREFLELLSTRANIDEDDSYPRASRTLRQVIRDRNFATFEFLLGLHVRVQYYRFPIPWPVLPNQFHAALKYADEKDDPFVSLLVRTRWDDIPAQDIKLKDKLLEKIGTNWRGF